ncbi:MAG: SCO1664 family protein [Motilibacteraceae bacterium]
MDPVALLDLADALRLLREGTIDVQGRLVDASNATLFGSITLDGVSAECVYKPRAGERPLWDFPDGTLAQREVAAYAVSAATGWDVVPPTVLREGPFGPGMCQLWVDVDETVELVDVVARTKVPGGWMTIVDALGSGGQPVALVHADDERLRRMAVLDAVINNADRKGGHVLPATDGRVHGVDHGVCFNEDEKLRTVLWGWAGQPFDEEERDVLGRLADDLDGDGPLLGELSTLLSRREVRVTAARVRRLLDSGAFPLPVEGWPAIPWPAF